MIEIYKQCQIHHFCDFTKVSLAGTGSYTNILFIILFSDGSLISEYRLRSLIIVILSSITDKFLPIHDLGPPENPKITNGGTLLHSDYHLSGLNSKGSLKYFGLYWLGKVIVPTEDPFEIGMFPIKWSLVALRSKIPGIGVAILKDSCWIHSM